MSSIGHKPGPEYPHRIEAIIEIPRDSRNKYEIDDDTGQVWLDRMLFTATRYPANYGFIPKTYCDDGDPLDVLVLGNEPVQPLSILRARAIGVMRMADGGKEDDKVVAVHVHDPAFDHYREMSELPPHTMREIQRFFEDYKTLEDKQVRIDGLGGAAEAAQVVRTALRLYQQRENQLRGWG